MTESLMIEIVKGVFAVVVAILPGLGVYLGAKIFKNKDGKAKLSAHPLFSKVELNKNVILTYFTLENKGKEVVFKEILVNHMDIYKRHTEGLCSVLDDNLIEDANELYSKSVEVMSNIITDLRTFYKFDNKFTKEEVEVLDIVMSKYNRWNYDRERELITRIQEICGSAFYPDIYTKAVTVFDTFLFAMNDTVSDANKTLNSINGDLKGLNFKGVVI